ncbi:hypothetical protein BBJ28_00001140 [Nothophytophthora sp. Chile5]|nr:hypothetical protein BBJ28_00001140 [Nothophytophthora sp. Chile5]
MLGGQRPGCEPLWEKIAARQLERRRNAEEENIKLRQLLKLQVKEAKNLKRVLKRRTKLEMMEKFMGSKLHEDRIYRSPGDNPQVFQELLRDTDSLYISVDKLFLEKGLYDLPCPGRWRQARGNVSNGMFLELTQKTVVPFDRQATDKAMWACLGLADWQGLQSVKDMGKQIHFHAHHTEEAGDTRMSSFFAKTSSSISSLRGVQIRKAVRKYEEADRTVFISQGLVEPKLAGDTDFPGFHTHTTLRLVVQQVDHLASGQGSVSLIESHFSASRFSQGLAAAREICSSTNLDMGVTIWDEAISRISHRVEALLIDETCKKVEGPYSAAP